MATYYVSTTGDNGANGLTYETPWLTLNYAASQVAAGDTVNIEPGIYREAWHPTTNGAAGSPIKWIGNISGDETEQPGLIYITALETEFDGEATGHTLEVSGLIYNEFYRIIIGHSGIWASDRTLFADGDNSFEGLLFEDCVVLRGDYYARCVQFDYEGGAAMGAANQLTFRRCAFFGELRFDNDSGWASSPDCGAIFENCWFDLSCGGLSISNYVNIIGYIGQTHGPSGWQFLGCTAIGSNGTYMLGTSYMNSTNQTLTVSNCAKLDQSIYTFAAMASLDESYIATTGQYVYATTSFDATDHRKIGFLLGAWLDPMMTKFFGFNPWAYWEPIWIDGQYQSDMVGMGNPAMSLTEDIYGRPRSAGRWASAGAIQGGPLPAVDSAVVKGGAATIRFDGSGSHKMLFPVDATVETTVSVWVRWNESYTGPKPRLEVRNVPGLDPLIATASGDVGAWYQLSVTFTPERTGVASIWFISADTSAADGTANFADVVISPPDDPGDFENWPMGLSHNIAPTPVDPGDFRFSNWIAPLQVNGFLGSEEEPEEPGESGFAHLWPVIIGNRRRFRLQR